jgi:hypothetical protein
MEDNDGSVLEVPIEQADATPHAEGTMPAEEDILRLQRINEYATQALSNQNVLESNVASLNGGLLRSAFWLEKTIREATARLPMTPERMQCVYRAIDAHLRVAKQVDRFAQFERRRSDTRPLALKANVSVDRVDEIHAEPGSGTSEESSS